MTIKTTVIIAVTTALFTFSSTTTASHNCTTLSSGERKQLRVGVHDGHLTIKEAILHWRCGNGAPVTVDAWKLTIHREKPWNADNWAIGVVQGLSNDFIIHGRVSMFATPPFTNPITVKSDRFDFDKRNDASRIRELEVAIGREAVKALIGEGKPFTIHFRGSPNVITNGYTYSQ